MRSSLPILLFCLVASGCRCGPDVATPVTLRIKNTDTSPIFVDATDGRLGMIIHRRVAFDWVPFIEAPSCPCLACDLVCGGCECAPEPPTRTVVKIEPGQTVEREWSGVVQVDSSRACGAGLVGGTACLQPENPPLNEEFQIEFCYGTSAPGAENADAGTIVPGSIPQASMICSEKRFRVEDLVVEVTPGRGTPCSQHADCVGDGELCFQGQCTTTCPATGYPELGGDWQVRIPEPTDQGFFTWTREGEREVYEGTGTLGSVRYENGTMTLQLLRAVGAGEERATVYLGLPSELAAPLSLGETLQVRLVDASTEDNPENRALVVRDANGQLILAAETAQQGRILSDAEIAPFTIARGEEILGCEHTVCGRNLFHATRFGVGAQTIALEPGDIEELVAEGQSWRVANVRNARYAETRCSLAEVMPWAVINERREGEAP